MSRASDLLDQLETSLILQPRREKRARSRRTRDYWPGGLFAREVTAPPQYRYGPRGGRYALPDRRADAVWVPKPFFDLGSDIITYEVKVTKADLQHELEDPSKAKAWSQFSNEFWLVILNESVIKGVDVPEEWGVMTSPSGNRVRAMTKIKEAPRLDPIDQEPAFSRLLMNTVFKKTQTELALQKALAEIEELRATVVDQQFYLDLAA